MVHPYTRRNREALIRILEALEAGDTQLAITLIDGELEDFRANPAPGAPCAGCGARFEWPGLRDAHQLHCAAFNCRAAA